jgi:hypothetical protein
MKIDLKGAICAEWSQLSTAGGIHYEIGTESQC